ncbi:uncharacterized protein LOC133305014 [Gastrolobium bilobum]|uniref:uncharacterized protein LOC133305014 n=1 Tax=Gastrolobium bilobum TaxID=150636 RepID=UPI002AB102BB|nr:uncharacterized protein LOC133305014 [Gastrolobium bilobum]
MSNPSSSYSPRLRFIDTKHKPSTITPSPLIQKDQNTHQSVLKLPPPPPPINTQPQLPRVLTKPKPQALLEKQENQKSVPKCKKVSNEKFGSRLKRPPQTSDIIRNKQEESFIIRPTSPSDIQTTKIKKIHPFSTNLLNNINIVPNLLPVKTVPSPPATKIPLKQLSSCSRQRYKQEGTSTLATPETSNNEDKLNGESTTGVEDHRPEFEYITGILNNEGTINTTTTTTVSFNPWFSPTHPLDPSIFHKLEQLPNNKDCIFTSRNQLGQRWNRRLLFNLVDEVLIEILRPKSNEKRLWLLHDVYCYQGSIEGLIEKVWKRVGKFPCAKCEVLEDIDGLIEAEDMEKVKVEGEDGMVEEREGLVAKIEWNIWDTLLHETVMVINCCC